MLEQVERLLAAAASSPLTLVYLLVAAGAAVENLFPPVPSDTFVLVGAILAERGVLNPWAVLGVAWASNVALALCVYGMGRRYGRGVFGTRWGHFLLRPHQLDRLEGFYARYGLVAIFGSRFLPVFRVLVPAFAGISHLGVWRTAFPLAAASGLWYALLVWAGMLASRNLSRLLDVFSLVNNWLGGAALGVVAVVLLWWFRSRRLRREAGDPDSGSPDGEQRKGSRE